MAGTYSQLFIQTVFAVSNRESLIRPAWAPDLHAYIGGIIRSKGQKPIIVNGVEDHIHVFFGLNPAMSVAELVRDIKVHSSRIVNGKKWVRGKFSWQSGYGAFSYARSQVEKVFAYIQNQQEPHRKRSFRDEYVLLLKKFELQFEEKYLFDWI